MNSNLPLRDNLSHKITETTILLKIQEKRVKKLKQKLENAQSECERLKDELEMYQNSMSPGPIHKCPAEVLSMIFKFAISTNPTHVRRLLLVCSRWHHLVVEDPQMWNVIKLRVPEECWDILSWANSASTYLTTCVELSQSATLDIELDFEHLRSTDFQLAWRLKFGFHELLSVVESGFDLSHVTEWAEGLEYYPLREYEDLTASCEPEHALDIIGDLIGPDGVAAGRWKYLKLIFPNRCGPSRMWYTVAYSSFPNLTLVSLKNLWCDDEVGPEEILRPAEFPAVEDLELDGSSQIALPLFPASLRTLSLQGRFESQCVHHLSRLTQLRILKIHVISKSFFERDDINSSLSLPLLQELHIIGDFAHLRPVELDLPSLRLVELHWNGAYTTNNLPVLNPLHLRPVIDSQEHDQSAKRVLQLSLLHFTGTKDLFVAFQHREILLHLVRELSHRGLLPTAWKTLSLHENDQITEVIEIQGIIGDK